MEKETHLPNYSGIGYVSSREVYTFSNNQISIILLGLLVFCKSNALEKKISQHAVVLGKLLVAPRKMENWINRVKNDGALHPQKDAEGR